VSAKIVIDPERQRGSIDPNIYGYFIEHLGRCIYGGIFDEGSPLSNDDGYRLDVLEAARELTVPILRWPGGNFVSGYHWVDGIGPRDERPRRMELAWHAEESNRFGTDEFIEYCRLLGAEPYICVNLGTGTLDEAQAWVEYCNGTGNTSWANLRRRNGHDEPYGVKYWGLGNEMYGHWQIGAKSAEDYAKLALECAKVMKRTDPSIKLVSCGKDGVSDWDRIVLERLAPIVDYHSIHIYTGDPDHRVNVAMPLLAERCIRATRALIEEVQFKQHLDKPIRIAYDEWNVWYRATAEDTPPLEERYDLSDALAVAVYLNVFQRSCVSLGMANLAQMVNVIAPIVTSSDGLFRQTIFYPLYLYPRLSGEISLDAMVRCDTYEITSCHRREWESRLIPWVNPVPALDVSVTRDEEGRTITLAVVNRLEDAAVSTRIVVRDLPIASNARVYEINGSNVHVSNDFDNPERVGVREKLFSGAGNDFIYEFPAHSVTVMLLEKVT